VLERLLVSSHVILKERLKKDLSYFKLCRIDIHQMKKYQIYEGTPDSRDEGDRFDSLREAKERASINAEQARAIGLQGFQSHVINTNTGEFVFTARIIMKMLKPTTMTYAIAFNPETEQYDLFIDGFLEESFFSFQSAYLHVRLLARELQLPLQHVNEP